MFHTVTYKRLTIGFGIALMSCVHFTKVGRKVQIIEIALSICALRLHPTFWEVFYWHKIWARGRRAQKQFMKLTLGIKLFYLFLCFSVGSADNRQIMLANGSIVSMSSLLSSTSQQQQQQQQQPPQQSNDNQKLLPSNNRNQTNNQFKLPNNPFENSLQNKLIDNQANHTDINLNNLPTSNGLSKQQNLFLSNNQNSITSNNNQHKLLNFNNNNELNDKWNQREKSDKKEQINIGSVKSLDTNNPFEMTTSHPSQTNEKYYIWMRRNKGSSFR